MGLGAAAALWAGQDAVVAAGPRSSAGGSWSVPRRGVLLDVARKYFTVAWLQRLIGYCGECGVNELHLHFSDDESIRIVSERFPEFNTGRQYTRAEVHDLRSYASDRGVSIIPELDMPGHMGAVLQSRSQFQLRNRFGIPQPTALDIADDAALRFAEDLIDDYAPVFAGARYWNMGFDEYPGPVPLDGLYSNLDERARQVHGPAATQHDLLSAVANRLARRVRGHGFDVSVWNDCMLQSSVVRLAPSIVVHYWTHWSPTQAPLQRFLDCGYTVMNFNDRQLYYSPGLAVVYPYPTARSIAASGWTPGQFSPLLPVSEPGPVPLSVAGPQTIAGPPYPRQLAGAVFSIWCDQAAGLSGEVIFRNVAGAIAAFARQCRDPD